MSYVHALFSEQGDTDKAMDMARGREGDTGFGVMKVVEALVERGHTERALEFFRSEISAEKKQYVKTLALIATAMVKEGKIMVLLQGDPSGWLQPPVDLGLGSSGSWWAAIVATNCPTAQARWQN